MKKIISVMFLVISLKSCGSDLEQKPYSFDNFKETPLWELAQAVKEDNVVEVKRFLKNKNTEIDLKEPKYHQTLLALAIQNKKRNAFIELLKAGANSNELLGDMKDATPFTYAVSNVENCDLFFVEKMLQYGANPNLKINNPTPDYFFQNSYPLLIAIGNTYDNGEECLELIKLLVNNGADINVCYQQPNSSICEGVISYSLTSNSIETLKYFVIERKISIPDTVIILGEGDKSTQEVFGLKEILLTNDYKYEDFERDGKKYDRSKLRKSREDILRYLEYIDR